MRTLILASTLCALSAPAFNEDPNSYCQNATELASITEQVPEYKPSWSLETPASLASPLRFDPSRLLSKARGLPVCIALLISESGDVVDAGTYHPKRVALTSRERDYWLSLKFMPAKQGGVPVKSLFAAQAEMK